MEARAMYISNSVSDFLANYVDKRGYRGCKLWKIEHLNYEKQ